MKFRMIISIFAQLLDYEFRTIINVLIKLFAMHKPDRKAAV